MASQNPMTGTHDQGDPANHGPAGTSVDHVIVTEMRNHHILGASVAIIQNGAILEAKGYGFTDETRTTPVTTDTLFQAGSISKPVAALGALRLVEDGRLTLDDDVNQWLKQWRVPDNEWTRQERVTLRRILSHSAGLTVHGFPGYEMGFRLPTLREILDGEEPANTEAIRVDVLPGSIWRYSGGGYTVLQQLIIDLTGRPFSEWMQETVLMPLNMAASTCEQPLPEDRVASAAAGYYAPCQPVEGRWHIYPEMVAAGLWSTASDLARFAIGIQEALAGRPNAVLSRAMTREMLTLQKGRSGLGVDVVGKGNSLRFSHCGRDEGFDAQMVACAETGQGVVLMINANDDSGAQTRIVQAVSREYHWPQVLSCEN